jgi:hypothetical protein
MGRGRHYTGIGGAVGTLSPGQSNPALLAGTLG